MNCHKWPQQIHVGHEQQHSPPLPQVYVGTPQNEKRCWRWGQIMYGYPNSHFLFLKIHLHIQPKLPHLTSKSAHKIPWLTYLTSTKSNAHLLITYSKLNLFFFKLQIQFFKPFQQFSITRRLQSCYPSITWGIQTPRRTGCSKVVFQSWHTKLSLAGTLLI